METNTAKVCITMEQVVIYLLMVCKLLNLKEKILILLQIHYIWITFQKTGQSII